MSSVIRAADLAAEKAATGLPTEAVAPLRELNDLLAKLQTGMTELLELAGQKLAGMRKADAQGLHDCAAREAALLKEVLYGQQQRNAILARLAQALHVQTPRPVTLSDISAALPEPVASALRARSAALQELARDLQRKNKIAASVAQNLQTHIRGVFAEIANVANESLGYSPAGKHEVKRTRCWVDAVG